MPIETCIISAIDDMAREMTKLVSLGVDEQVLAEAHPSPQQTKDLLKGLLYLREMYPLYYRHH